MPFAPGGPGWALPALGSALRRPFPAAASRLLVAVAPLNAGSPYAPFLPAPSGISNTNSPTGHLAPLRRRRGWVGGWRVPMSQDTLPSSCLEGRWTLILVGFREEAALALPVLPFPGGRCGPVGRPRGGRAGAPGLPRARLAPGPRRVCMRGREWLCRAWRRAVGRRSPGARMSPTPKVCGNSKASAAGPRSGPPAFAGASGPEQVRARRGRGAGLVALGPRVQRSWGCPRAPGS